MLLRNLVISALVAVSLTACSVPAPQDSEHAVSIKLIALNDFHGQLKVDPNDRSATVSIKDGNSVKPVFAGGAAYLGTLVQQLKASSPHAMVIAAGDIIGAAQPISGLTSEEAAIDVMNQIGLEVSAVGNHEFDKGKDELLRLQNGGCKPTAKPDQIGKITCINNSQSGGDGKFAGAKFKYLAANVINDTTGKPLFAPTITRQFGGATLGFIGVTFKETPRSTRGAGGLTFLDEASVINQKAMELKQAGADAVIVLLHQGGQTSATHINDFSCPNMRGELQPVVARLRNVDVVVSGHTHQEYICTDQATGILFTSAGYYGRLVTNIDLRVVPGKGVVEKKAQTVPVVNSLNKAAPDDPALAPDPATQAVIDAYDTATAKILNEVRGYTSAALSNCKGNQSLEMPMGNVVADAYLDSYLEQHPNTTYAIAFTNGGGIRASVPKTEDGAVTYGALQKVTPFGNTLVYKQLTGAQIKTLLEEQWSPANCAEKKLPTSPVCGRLLQPARSLRYAWDWSLGQGKARLLTSVEVLNLQTRQWQPLVDTAKYTVITNEYLADGGDKFPTFKSPQKIEFHQNDLDALVKYFEKMTHPGKHPDHRPLPVPTPRVTCQNCPPLTPAELGLCKQ